MLSVGLTGGIGSGKSTVAELFADLGVPVIDADIVAREVVAPDSPLLGELVDAFGAAILRPDGALDRALLRRRVFADPAERSRLEAILHPAIRTRMSAQAASATGPYALLVIPLLIEKGWRDMVDRVLVVDCPEEQQLERAMARDGSDAAEVRAIVASQASRMERRAAADDLIANTGSLDKLRQQVQDLHRFYLQLAATE